MPRAALRGRYHLGVAGEALRRLLGRTDAQARRHLPATRVQQHAVGARVRIELRPGDVLVLQDAVRLDADLRRGAGEAAEPEVPATPAKPAKSANRAKPAKSGK